MDSQTLLNVGLVLLFVLVGGVFAATEIALVSLRDSQLTALERFRDANWPGCPVRFRRYTGQERTADRNAIRLRHAVAAALRRRAP